MPPKKLPTVWSADPHTIAKIQILERYLGAWFPIVGRKYFGKDIWYIDGFAGPGKYENHPEGSPIVALRRGVDAISKAGKEWKSGSINFLFIEEDKDRFEVLKEEVSKVTIPGTVKVGLLNKTFEAGFKVFSDKYPKAFDGSNPLFAFIDPFGATGSPFSIVEKILSSSCSEVLINLDADGIARIFRAADRANSSDNLNLIYGGDTWESIFDPNAAFHTQCKNALLAYTKCLQGIPNVKYVFPFEMQSTSGLTNYFLLFGSQHRLGLEKMKEAMKALSQDGSYRFVDSHVAQESLFRFDDPNLYVEPVCQAFKGNGTTYSELSDFVLLNTPFTNPKSLLKILESKGLIQIEDDGTRKVGTHPEEKIIRINFG